MIALADDRQGATSRWRRGSTNFALQPKVSQRVVSNERLRDRLRRHVERTHSRLDSRLAAI
jgi:hypothetical protein